MTDQRRSSRARSATATRDRGFTLIEVLIVTITMGIIVGTLATVVTVVLRTAPPSEVRADDARSLQGLVTWLPQDVDAAPPGGFDTGVTSWPCAGPAPANSFNLLVLEWTERKDATDEYAATYRYEFDGSEWHIARFSCDDGGTATMGAAERQNLTSALPAWNNLAPPASVKMCDTAVDTAGNCPAGHEILTSTSPDVESLKFTVTRIDGVVTTIDAAPKNPDQDLADDPFAVTNAVPTLSQTNYLLEMYAGATVTLDLNTTHAPTDADGDALSVAIDSSEPMPPGITATTADPLFVTVNANAGLLPGTISPKLILIVSDPRAGWVDATVTIKIIPQPNDPPTVSPSTYHLVIAQNTTVVLPLGTTHGATDPNGDPLTVSVLSYPVSVATPPTTGHPGPLDLRIKASGSAPLGPAAAPISLLIQDNRGGSVMAEVTLEFIPATSNNPPTVTTTNHAVSMYEGDSVTLDLYTTHGANDVDGDPLSAEFDGAQPTGVTTTFNSGLGVTLTTAVGLPDGPIAQPVRLHIVDIYGAEVDATISVTIVPRPPPPSDCVLGSLTVNPSTVNRQGNGTGPRHLTNDVTVSLTHTGSCDGLVLKYDTGDTSGLGVGTGRVFPPGSPASIVIYAKGNGGTEKWLAGTYTLTASTTSAVTPSSVTATLTVN